MRRAAWLIAATLACAGCIDKPLRPSERPDGAPGDEDAGADAAACDDPVFLRTSWEPDDKIRFEQTVAQLNGDCFDDILVPGSLGGSAEGVFVILGRATDDFFIGGYDQFVPTTDSEPLRVAATDLVGGPPLDLVVFARSTEVAREGEGEVRVFEGIGDGTFLGEDVSRQIAGSDFPSPPVDADGHYTLEPMSASAGGAVELLVGDTDAAYVVAPDAWSQAGLDDAEVFEPFADMGTQGVMVAPSGRAGADDLVQVDFATWEWYVNSGALDFTPGQLDGMLDNGPRALRRPDARATTPIASVSAQAQSVTCLFVDPPPGPDVSGGIEVKPFADSPVETADGQIDALELIGLGGDTAPELLVLDAGGGSDPARVRLYHDLTDSGTEVTSSGEGIFDVAPFDADHPYNRMVLGAFRSQDQVKLYVFSGSPAVTPPICWLPDPETGDFIDCD